MRAEVAWLFGTERYAVYITNWILYNYLVIKLGAAVVCNIHTDSERWRARGWQAAAPSRFVAAGAL